MLRGALAPRRALTIEGARSARLARASGRHDRDAETRVLGGTLPAVDLLSDVLSVIKLDSAIYFNAEFSEPWSLRTPETREVAPLLAPGAHVIVYHLLSEGSAYAGLLDGERVPLAAGDIVMFPHGDPHVLGNGVPLTTIDAAAVLPEYLESGLELARGGGGGPPSRFICGFLACDPQLGRAFVGGLPPLVKVNIRDSESGRWIEDSLRFSVNEAAAARDGAQVMLTRLAEVVFAETLRRYVRDLPPAETGWLAGTRDPEVGQALTVLHQRFAEPWTVAGLAHEVGLSRTVLADRFRHFLGETPIAYLTRWRLRVGARALVSTARSVAQVAADVGYESEAAFNRAFKREYDLPPAQYRKAARMAVAD
jgi:AraC-like DNA-binding protein